MQYTPCILKLVITLDQTDTCIYSISTNSKISSIKHILWSSKIISMISQWHQWLIKDARNSCIVAFRLFFMAGNAHWFIFDNIQWRLINWPPIVCPSITNWLHWCRCCPALISLIDQSTQIWKRVNFSLPWSRTGLEGLRELRNAW